MLAIILAAGQGTRMRSARPKVLHPVGGRPMVGHVAETAARAGARRLALVVGPGSEGKAVSLAVEDLPLDVEVRHMVQEERLGTAHAVLCARQALAAEEGSVIVLFGDTPLVSVRTIETIAAALDRGATVCVAGFEAADPAGYGRLLVENGRLVAIREDRDASDQERSIRLCNGGLMGFAPGMAMSLLEAIGADNAQGEYYLTDAVALANKAGHEVVAVSVEGEDVFGVNDRVQLAEAERVFQRRAREAMMRAGVTMIAPETVTLSHDTRIGEDTLIEPNVVFGPGVDVAQGVTVRAFSHLEGTSIATGAVVGPFARLRPGAHIGPDSRIGNFVEIKNARVEEGAKVNHLSYIGDARVGARANVGAGTITCNYDGFDKHFTDIGAGAFIGSDTALVAPVRIGEGAYTGSGSVITRDVEADALAIARGRQAEKPGWAKSFRAKKTRAGKHD